MVKEDEVKCATQEDLESKYSKEYDDKKASILLVKLRSLSKNTGPIFQPTLTKILTYLGMLISALENKETPTKYKILLMGAIGYIILPLDLIPDVFFPFGWLDDIASVTGVIGITQRYSTFSLEKLDKYIEKHFPNEKDKPGEQDILVIDNSSDDQENLLDNAVKTKSSCIVVKGELKDRLDEKKFSKYSIIEESSKQKILVLKGKKVEYYKKRPEYIKNGYIDRDEINQDLYTGEIKNV